MAFRSSNSFADECLLAINQHRAKHQVSPLKLNSQISRIAQKWAEYLARSGDFRHNDSAQYNGDELGENIAMRWSSDGKQFSGDDFVEQWYNEVKNYDFRKNGGDKTGHFTQVVWKGSAELGVGKAIGSDGKWIVVANFYPAGNFLGEFQNNVFPPRDGKIILKVPASTKAPARISPGPTANDFPYSRASPAPFLERVEVRRSPQPSYVGPQSRTINSPNTFSFSSSSSASSSSYSSPYSSSVSESTNLTFLGRQVRTEKCGRTTKTIVIETFRKPDGSTKTVQTESVSNDDDNDDFGQVSRQMRAFQLNNDTTFSGAASRAMPAPSFSSSPSSKSPWTTGRVQSGVVGPATQVGTSRTGRSSPQVTPSGGSTQRDFIDEVVKSHNQYRRQHGSVGDLRLSSDLCDLAQQWAERIAACRTLKHSGATFRGKPMGENLACKYGSGRVDYTGKEVVKGWYDEIKDFNFRYPDNSNLQAIGHFSQVVWKGSQEIGVGKARSNDGAIFVVCNYLPAGNIIGRFKENVFPAK